jgi:hypothetical protein
MVDMVDCYGHLTVTDGEDGVPATTQMAIEDR